MNKRLAFMIASAAAVPLPLVIAPSAAHAQAELSAKVDWDSDKPRRVQFQSNAGNSDFRDRSTHFEGREEFRDRLYESLLIIVRYPDGSSIPFPVRAQVDASQFSFTVEKPPSDLICNLGMVDALEPKARSRDQNVLIATMQAAHKLTLDDENPCPTYLKKRVAKTYFDASCNLAKRTSFFDISAAARRAVLEAYRGSRALPAIQRQIRACEKEVRSEVIAPVAAAMRVAVNTNDFDRYKQLDANVSDLLEDPEWNEAAENVLEDDHFDDLRVEAQARERRVIRRQEIEAEVEAEISDDNATLESADEMETASPADIEALGDIERLESEAALQDFQGQ